MGKKKGEPNATACQEKEGKNLLGAPTFQKLENGRFKCVETGHELPVHGRDTYAQSKHCRLGLIDSAMARNKPPVNMFLQDPLSRSKLICKLTGVTINKSEEHIWKHINGKRFLTMLERKEAEKEMPNGTIEKLDEEQDDTKKKKKKKKDEDGCLKKKKKKIINDGKDGGEIINEVRDSVGENIDLENDDDFWMPPVGERWDHDDGGDRWGSDPESGSESDGAGEEVLEAEEAMGEAGQLSKQTKRMSLEIGPSDFSSRKKKKKTDDA